MKLLLFALMMFTSTFSIAEEVKKDDEENILIPVRLEDNGEIQVEAKLSDLKPEAHALGLHELTLQGTKKVTSNKDTEEVEITWNKAYIIKQEGEKKSTNLITELYSDLVAQPTLEKGDKFTAEGSLETLLLALQKLKEEEKIEEEKESENQQIIQAQPALASEPLATSNDIRPTDFESPQFDVKPDPVITTTTDGCSIKVDIAQMAAIVQERTLQDGEEITPCDDTLTRYPIEKAYGSCPLSFDTPNMRAYEQHILRYSDPESGGFIQVQDCSADGERAIALIEDTRNCSIRHDFLNDISYQQAEITYEYQGEQHIFQSCADTETSYAHVTTMNTCSPIVDQAGGFVTFQERDKIVVDSQDVYISSCTPNPSTQVAIETGDCASPRYTHDFNTSQSYLNQDIYYTDQNSERVDIQTCAPSQITFEHKQDESQCTAQHNDVTKETTLYARTYIEEEIGTPIYISTCEAVVPTVPYTRLHAVWRKTGSATRNLDGGYDTSGYTWTAPAVTSPPINWGGSMTSYKFQQAHSAYNPRGGTSYIMVRSRGSISGQRYCVTNSISAPYSAGGVTLDSAYSDQSPSFTQNISTSGNCGGYGAAIACGGRDSDSGRGEFTNTSNWNGTVSLNCSIPSCLVSDFVLNPVYLRGDNSEFTDTNTVEGTKSICGTGSSLEGVTE